MHKLLYAKIATTMKTNKNDEFQWNLRLFQLKFSVLLQFNEVIIILKEKREFFVFNWLKNWKLYVLKVRRFATPSAGESSGLGHIGTTGHRAQFCCGLWLDGWLNHQANGDGLMLWRNRSKVLNLREKETRVAERGKGGVSIFVHIFVMNNIYIKI